MIVSDLLHEFGPGVWKDVYIHLLRILTAAGGDKINELDKRYRFRQRRTKKRIVIAYYLRHRFRSVPSFGRDTIRRFQAKCSELKRPAAYEYEDILLVSPLTSWAGRQL